ncbi:hypothetical protein [uncultured Pseudoxanthomonas sp.]|uniref:hypothetical protein n=1 Tax=uncultured Pseudoxanthomonas sp. TaxID=281701 RepID=UPI0026386507|nr:hypothetical protein [uncultured Pseudoxanthomonas sp.]
MHPPARNASPLPWIAVALLVVSALPMWWPALQTPFWGDDYVFLHAAHATNAMGAPWWSDFWPSSPPRFWRPLSQEGYWRWIDVSLGGSAHAAHVVSLILHVLATLGVALFALRLARACRWQHAGRIAALAGAVYGGLTMHLLPVHWAAAANNALLTLFTTLLLAAWIGARDAAGSWRAVLLASLPAWLALALLSKESAALTPALMIVVAAFVAMRRPDRGELVAWLACVAVVGVWLVLRARFTANTDASYAFGLGSNVVRNAASFGAWLLNVPREAMRMAVAGERMQGLAWIAATALPMLAAWAVAGWRGRTLLTRWQWMCVGAFAVLAYAPYFLFAWNSYEYYAAIAVILPVIALARCLATDAAALWVAMLIVVSSWIAVEGTRRLDHPGLIGRAHWAETTLQALESQRIPAPLHVSVADAQRFYAIGQVGLAWRLGLDPEQVRVAPACPPTGTCLVIGADGRTRWRHAAE